MVGAMIASNNWNKDVATEMDQIKETAVPHLWHICSFYGWENGPRKQEMLQRSRSIDKTENCGTYPWCRYPLWVECAARHPPSLRPNHLPNPGCPESCAESYSGLEEVDN